MKQVFIAQFHDSTELTARMKEGMNWIDAPSIIPRDAHVFIKPNLTWVEPTPGVTTTPQMLEALVAYLTPQTSKLVIGESNGGQNCFIADEAFERHGVYDIATKYGAKVVNLSNEKREFASTTVGAKEIVVELPSILLHDIDIFITLPVPKVHAMTQVSLGFKNQWGCQPDIMRFRNHPHFADVIIAINKLLNSRIAVFDGTYFLNRTGPMVGEPVKMDSLIISNDIGAGSLACCEIMQINPKKVKHFRIAQQEGMFPRSSHEIRFNRPPSQFSTRKFHLDYTMLNWAQLSAFKFRWANRFFHDSKYADPLHEFIFWIRRNPMICRLLSGQFGPGEARRRSSY